MSNLTLAEATALLADPAGAVGFPDQRRDDTSSNVVAFDKPKKGLSISEGASLLSKNQPPRSRNVQQSKKRQIQDDGGRLEIADAARLLVGMSPKSDGGRLTKSEGVAALLGRITEDNYATSMTQRQAADMVSVSPEKTVQIVPAARDYTVEATTAAMDLQRINASMADLERQCWDFVYACAQAFPEMIHDRTAHLRLEPHRAALWLSAQVKGEQFGEMATKIQAAQQYAWNRVVEVENREFQAQNPDLDEGDADRMAALLLAFISKDEAATLAATPAMVSANAPGVRQILAIAAGSEDGEDMLAMLRDAGFTDDDINAIASGSAQAHLLDHRVRNVLLKASRNADFSEVAA